MTHDPFADETQASSAPPAAGSWQADQSRPQSAPAPTPGEGKVVVTLKGLGGPAAPWVVLHADSAQDALAQLDDAMAELLKKTAQVTRFFHGITDGQAPNGGSQRQPGQRQTGGQPGRPPGASQPPANVAPEYCAHGEMEFKTGFSQKKQKTWKAFDCPQGQCPRKWVND